jgi:hypothetical protein
MSYPKTFINWKTGEKIVFANQQEEQEAFRRFWCDEAGNLIKPVIDKLREAEEKFNGTLR